MTVGVVAALPAEAAAFCGQRLQAGAVLELDGALLACGGIGVERARAAATDLVARGASGLCSWGIAAGLRPDLRAGDLLLPTEVQQQVSDPQPRFACDAAWRSALEARISDAVRVYAGSQLCSDHVIATRAEKTELQRTGALGADMESAAIGDVSAANDLPFLVVRAVSDPAQQGVPRSARVAMDAGGRFQTGPFLASLLTRPQDLVALLRLRSGLRAAQQTLRRVVALVGVGLGR